jgi:phosphoglycerate kinase
MLNIDNYNFEGKRALIRVDFNVPLNDQFEITDDTRIVGVIPTLKTILEKGGSIVLMSHLGRPENGPEEQFSLKHLVNHIIDLTGVTVQFGGDCIGEEAFKLSSELRAGEILLLDNLRFHKEETTGDVAFAEKLSQHGDVYVNDAFGTAHRAHASTAIITQFFKENKMFGKLLAKELDNIDKVIQNPKSPMTAIMGGAKVSSKIDIINQLMDKVDNLIIGGGMSYTFAKAMGGNVGSSLVEDDKLDLALELIAKAKAKGVNLMIPSDSVNGDQFSNEANVEITQVGTINDGWMGLDIGENTIKDYTKVIEESSMLLWNGPMGVFEMSKFENGTKAIALSVAKATKNGAFSLIGGGDSVAAINKYNLGEEVSYVSTGGGALLEYLEGKVLPGVAAIRD